MIRNKTPKTSEIFIGVVENENIASEARVIIFLMEYFDDPPNLSNGLYGIITVGNPIQGIKPLRTCDIPAVILILQLHVLTSIENQLYLVESLCSISCQLTNKTFAM